jgi:hypothetical protein
MTQDGLSAENPSYELESNQGVSGHKKSQKPESFTSSTLDFAHFGRAKIAYLLKGLIGSPNLSTSGKSLKSKEF